MTITHTQRLTDHTQILIFSLEGKTRTAVIPGLSCKINGIGQQVLRPSLPGEIHAKQGVAEHRSGIVHIRFGKNQAQPGGFQPSHPAIEESPP